MAQIVAIIAVWISGAFLFSPIFLPYHCESYHATRHMDNFDPSGQGRNGTKILGQTSNGNVISPHKANVSSPLVYM